MQQRHITKAMLEALIVEVMDELEQSATNSKKIKRIADIPGAWEKDVDPIDLNQIEDWRTEQDILQDQVKQKWKEFVASLTELEKATLARLLGKDKKCYSIDELKALQGSLKGK